MSHSLVQEPAVSNGNSRLRTRLLDEVWRKRLLPVGALLVVLVAWELCVRLFAIKPFVAPAPSAVFSVLFERFGLLMWNLQPTVIETLLGFALGNAIAIVLAIVFVYRQTAEEALFPLAVMINSVPVVAVAPILVLLFGNGLESKLAIVGLVCFFPTLVNMVRGLRAVSPQHLELMRILSASEYETFTKLRIKAALPYLFAALKIAASTSVIGAIVSEWIGANRGIGALILQATFNFDSPLLYATITVGSIFSALFFAAVSLLERHYLKWSNLHAN